MFYTPAFEQDTLIGDFVAKAHSRLGKTLGESIRLSLEIHIGSRETGRLARKGYPWINLMQAAIGISENGGIAVSPCRFPSLPKFLGENVIGH